MTAWFTSAAFCVCGEWGVQVSTYSAESTAALVAKVSGQHTGEGHQLYPSAGEAKKAARQVAS